MTPEALLGGFAQAPQQSSRAFRAALTALSRPGTIVTVTGATPPAPLSVAAGVLILTLCDGTTPLFLGVSVDRPIVRDWVAFHTGAPMSSPEKTMFAVGSWADLLPLDRFATGIPDYPDRSATLIIEVTDLQNDGARLSGPGIATDTRLLLPDLAAFQANHHLFPMGFDAFLTCGNRLAAVPRSTTVEA